MRLRVQFDDAILAFDVAQLAHVVSEGGQAMEQLN
jgi:hypothetical protein